MEISESQIILKSFCVGSKLLVQCKNDWRTAVVSKIGEEKILLTVCSPSGRTYRKICAAETTIFFDGKIPFLGAGIWRESFVKYDLRW